MTPHLVKKIEYKSYDDWHARLGDNISDVYYRYSDKFLFDDNLNHYLQNNNNILKLFYKKVNTISNDLIINNDYKFNIQPDALIILNTSISSIPQLDKLVYLEIIGKNTISNIPDYLSKLNFLKII